MFAQQRQIAGFFLLVSEIFVKLRSGEPLFYQDDLAGQLFWPARRAFKNNLRQSEGIDEKTVATLPQWRSSFVLISSMRDLMAKTYGGMAF